VAANSPKTKTEPAANAQPAARGRFQGNEKRAAARLAHHPETKRYATRRTAEGKTPREIKRCLKRQLARQLFRILATKIEAS
jgi:hypothetical protein